MNSFKSVVKGKRVLIFGVGRQGGGVGDARWLKENGAIVKLSDRDTSIVSEGQTQEQIDWAELIIKNPGVPDDHELLRHAKDRGIPVMTSIAIFVKYTSLTTIGITGTRGKSTTTELIARLLDAAFPNQSIKGGNIPGTSGLALFDQEEDKKYAVLELSSFQLHNFHDLRISPEIAVITNLYPDHLNRYRDMTQYQSDKEAIVRYQDNDGVVLYNQDNEGATNIASVSSSKKIGYSARDVTDWETDLPGSHNRENIAAMAKLGEVLGIPKELCKRVVQDFHGLASRLEIVRELDDVVYINDTTATTPVAATKALQSMISPTIWITGGDSKNLPFIELIEEVKINTHLKKIVILGSKNIPQYTTALAEIVGDKIVGTAGSMAEAVELATSQAEAGDAILLSPGFASFDLFKNEFDRGEQFNTCVHAL